MKWITRERPKIDRIACPWLVARFIDAKAEFIYVPKDKVMSEAERLDATPFDVPGVELGHHGPLCSFDAFIRKYGLNAPALERLARIVRGADTDLPELAPEVAGLFALSWGLHHNYQDDHELLALGMVMYDALYAWCSHSPGQNV